MAIESSLNFRRVSDHVTTSGSVSAEDLAQLGSLGYEVVINLLPDRSQYALREESSIVAEQGLAYEYIPIDFATPEPEQFEQFVAAMDGHSGRVIHVHCAANYRVSAFYSLYAMKKGWWSVEQADEHLGGIWTQDEFPVWDQFIANERQRLS